MNPILLANNQQREASSPRVSAFVSASAGSGKTKLLTDRLLRLMLAGTAPEKILCLTYTKAAAAEMVLRLNRRLGDWVVMSEDQLARELRALDVPVMPKTTALARQLFADVLDLPGGMRIETIHAFCQSLLRRFPLEAGLSPHFEVADENLEAMRLREARERVLAGPEHGDAITALAAETDEQRFAALTKTFAKEASGALRAFAPGELRDMQGAALGAGDASAAELLAQAVQVPDEARLRAGWQRIAAAGNKSGVDQAEIALDFLSNDIIARVALWESWEEVYFTKSDKQKPRDMKGYFGKKLANEAAFIEQLIDAEGQRIDRMRERIKAARLAELNAHLTHLTAPILAREQADKTLAAQLSYGDLVSFTSKLLVDPGAAWILYKLDGGIDHLLLDEVQDTAPEQWAIAGAIADEFFAGSGARAQKRSIFAVGDAKQSIFSFQGADLASFESNRAKFREKVKAAGENWVDGELSVSFRSTAPVLALVDAVFAAGPACEGVCAPGDLHHEVSRAKQGGSVTLWPLTAKTEAAELPAWAVPSAYVQAASAKTNLAAQIAAHIRARLDARDILPARGRPVTPGDFLILLRTREGLMGAITRALKRENVPVAGADRMVLTEQLAVSDLMALCDALLLPEDDLAFAQFLASPLGGLTDESLMALALKRRGYLFTALYARAAERADWSAAKTFFEALREKTGYLTPFALLSEALGPLGGRARLLRRLGAEAAEPMDEFLSEALNHAQTGPASLQGLLHEFRQSGASIRREAEAAGDVVRIMTVHGAKGLQAPIVILPDTAGLPDTRENLFWLPVPQQPDVRVPIFCPRANLRSAAVAAAVAQERAATAAEHNRLLYVALTRAEDELIICGAEPGKKLPDTSWYASVQAGFTRLPGAALQDGTWHLACPHTAEKPDRASRVETAPFASPPAWAGAAPLWSATAPARETTRPERIAPSRSAEDAASQALAASPLGAGLVELRRARAAALAKGRAIHALLQHLPDLQPQDRADAALRYLARLPELAGQEAEIWPQLRAILTHPELAPLFGPGSRAEVPLAGIVGDAEIGGLVDRLAVTEGGVIIADYKTNRHPPETPEAIPENYLRQLAAYEAILSQIYPDKQINCVLIWTANAHVMPVPHALLTRHAPA
jgi:ATP-dependent helicase/nuclease subunit A